MLIRATHVKAGFGVNEKCLLDKSNQIANSPLLFKLRILVMLLVPLLRLTD